jgi:molybdopterin-containing oxidoreductase family membrane subunit
MIDPRTGEYAVIAPGHNFRSVTQKIAGIVLTGSTPWAWWGGLFFAATVAMGVVIGVTWLVLKGVGIWGVTIPGAWGFAIINFVWWIGIGHAGTLISAILLLFKQGWRNSINRFAEAMTIFAVCCAALFPLLHIGRPWLGYWLLPYPNSMNVWPQFRSPLAWDVFAVSTYATISVVFWYIGMVPDFGTLRDRATLPIVKYFYGLLSLGWRGSTRHWIRYESASLLLAGLSTPLVLSVHTVISFDFAVAALAGWHTTIFPPYFVAGAVFAGFAMVLLFAIPVRHMYKLKDLITDKHLDWCARIMLVTGLIVAYGYMCEAFYGWYAGGREWEMMTNRFFGPYAWSYWMLIACNVIIPQTMWVDKWRRNELVLVLVALDVSLGMWLERWVIIITGLQHAEQPTMRHMYYPTMWDWGFFIGTMGFFTFMMFLFIRFVPMINIFEMKDLLHWQRHNEAHAEPHAEPALPAPVAVAGE